MKSLLDTSLLSTLRSLSHTPAPPPGPDVEEGFDIFPPLASSDMNRYAAFLHRIRTEFAKDPNVREDPSLHGIGGIVFDVAGEQPWVPLDGRRFLRFSAVLHGPTSEPHTPGAGGPDDYLARVEAIAMQYFAERVHSWSENCETAGWRKHGVYNWMEVRHAVTHVFKEEDERVETKGEQTEVEVAQISEVTA
ncbi:hypothetical protein CspeluHIS016_0400810 [Cutaneotrichosporon spelunceum]|uniref:Uncharacterized protein n=1 Tax=Cutaneotrichosporon spelunceum TaxID=1672016 RepID=A0AAD3YCT9_9TREE|nr:hypothetical protein CspeluHIS016_0400810 [Cutaneotrichosporon spelunceum]